MKTLLRRALAVLAVAAMAAAAHFALIRSLENQVLAAAPSSSKPMLAHNVYFSLAESTPENREKLAAACHNWLSGHPGVVFFAVGTPSNLDREVNDRDFDVGLHLVFEDREAHDRYQPSERHQKFVSENKHLWKRVRVFDSDVYTKR
jgi:hypothetical protein